VAPIPIQAQAGDEVGPFRPAGHAGGERRIDFRYLAGIDGRVRRFEREGHLHPVAIDRRDAHLRVAQEHHPARPPVIDGVREGVDVHEEAVVLPRPEPSQLAPGVEHARLGAAPTGVKQVEIKLRGELADRCRDERAEADA
jgi:hypothetical protein